MTPTDYLGQPLVNLTVKITKENKAFLQKMKTRKRMDESELLCEILTTYENLVKSGKLK